ncbi:hypothetical protein ACEWY4_027351 [Coilia grayii]|uniref:Uncharacterized protein n=1 Tax=Coilia grayii TaxID=363190 RepID=A0ABD1ISQ8_9TELE
MAHLSHASDSQALVQSMLQRLRLQEQRSDQASTTSEDISSRILQDVLDDGQNAAVETLTGAVGDNLRTPRTKWPGFRKASTKTSELSKGNTRHKDSLSFSDIEEVPRWERKQLRFAVAVDRISERKNGLVDEVQGHLQPRLNYENHTSRTVAIVDPGVSGEPLTQLTPGCVTQMMTASDRPRQDSLTIDDSVSFTDSFGQHGQAVDVEVVTEKNTDNVRKNKRKWAETKTKRFTQKIKEKWRDRHPSMERRNSRNGEKHTTDEQGSQENVVLPSPIGEAESEVTLSAQGYDSLFLATFDLGFSTSLMEEIFTGPEWTKFLAFSSSPQVNPENTDAHNTYLADGKQCEMFQEQITPAVFDSEAMLTDSDTASDNAGVMTYVGRAVYIESGKDSGNQLTSSEEVSHNQLWIDEMNSADQNSNTKYNSNESQSITENLEQYNVQDICHDQSETVSESNTGDIKDQNQMDSDLSQMSTSDVNPYQTEITAPAPEQTTASEINPHKEVMATPDTLDQPDTNDMVNPYLETQAGDVSETEDVSPYLLSQTGPNSNLGEGEENAPQLLSLMEFSYLKAGEGENSSAHDRRRRALHLEERETFIDEDNDDEDDTPSKSLSWKRIPLSPPPFPPPLPPQRTISVDSDSSSSLEIVPKKRRLDSTPRHVRFAEEVVILPAYIQPDVEDWPEEEEDEEEMEDAEDMDDREDMQEMTVPQEISSTKEATESPREAQPSLYNWILGITKKTKRKAQI